MSQIPSEILNDEELNKAIAILPSNYNFEIHKSVWHIRKSGAKRVALQLPEGLLLYSCIISDILEQFCGVETIVMGDVTYGACCIDDFTAIALGCDFLIHYAHSCLVPVDVTKIKVLYVFVTINIDTEHLVNTLSHNFKSGSRLALVSTIQFNPTIHDIHTRLLQDHGITTNTPQTKPLSKGEVLGCTSAKLPSKAVSTDEGWDAIVYVGDGRFHLESAMIHNPDIPAYKYDPYSRKFTIEEYDTVELDHARRAAIAVVPSRVAEALGLTALEAHAAGAALISSGRGGLREASGPHAIYVDPPEADGLAAAMQHLVRHDAERADMAREAQAFVAQTHAPALRAAELDDLRLRLTESRSLATRRPRPAH